MGKAERTKEYIIEKIAPVFNMKGYAGTSLNDMTEVTGLTKGSLYGNFSNKDELAVAAFEFNLNKTETLIREEMAKHDTIKDKLMVYVHVYEHFPKSPFPTGGCPLLNTAVEADDTHPQLKAKASAAILDWKKKMVRLIEKGIERKEFRKDVDAEQTALAIIALLEGGIMITKLTGRTNYMKAVLTAIEKQIEDLL
jgi:AcrR family transcriptional regulator